MRVTQKDLECLVERLNVAAGFNNPKYSTVGSYTLSYAYGGVSLHQYTSKHGAVRDVFSSGHITKKDLYNRLRAYLEGMSENLRLDAIDKGE